jgi:integrase
LSKAEYVESEILEHVLASMMPANARACRVSLATGLRIGDVLLLRPDQIAKQRFTIREQKTGKSRRLYLPKALWLELQRESGDNWVFPGRNPKKHRSRQAVWADVNRAKKIFRIGANISPHSMRKIAAVELFRRTGDLAKVRDYLNHNNDAVTLIYALADSLAAASKNGKKRKKKPP